MDALDALASIDAELQALSHPLGSLAYQQAVAQRAEPSGRDVLAYEDAPAPPLMDDELAEAMKQGAADESRGLLYGEKKAGISAAAAPSEGWGGASKKDAKKRPRQGGVDLPQWMDLDQETLPNAPALEGQKAARKRPVSLDAYGGVGELTVQMRTARGGLGGDRAFDALLSHHERAKEREEARLAREQGRAWHTKPPDGYVCHICQQPGESSMCGETSGPRSIPATAAAGRPGPCMRLGAALRSGALARRCARRLEVRPGAAGARASCPPWPVPPLCTLTPSARLPSCGRSCRRRSICS